MGWRLAHMCVICILLISPMLIGPVFSQDTGDITSTHREQCDEDGIVDRQCLQALSTLKNDELAAVFSSIREAMQREWGNSAQDGNAWPAEKEWYEQRIANLDRSQETWRAYREATCHAAQHNFAGGSLAFASKHYCLIDLTQARIDQLKRMYVEELAGA